MDSNRIWLWSEFETNSIIDNVEGEDNIEYQITTNCSKFLKVEGKDSNAAIVKKQQYVKKIFLKNSNRS